MTSGVVLGIRLRFHNHAPQQGAVVLAFDEAAPHQIRTHDLGGAAEERLGQGWEILDDGTRGLWAWLKAEETYTPELRSLNLSLIKPMQKLIKKTED